MAEVTDLKQSEKKTAMGPEMERIVEDIEDRARILQQSGRLSEAENLRDWATELRQKSIHKPF